jgi:O-acetyl-ADP-ribose deacetylase (regulator of RNase III)
MRRFGNTSVDLARGDITRETVDTIVNAANSSLLGGGGVDGAIHRAGGPTILEECRKIRDARGPLPAGEAVITGAGRLPCRYVIHTVGPVWQDGRSGEPETLARCYRNSLALAAEQGLKSLAFPSISTGAYGYPVAEAAAVALGTVRDVLQAGSPLEQVRFVLFTDSDLAVYRAALERL